MNIACIVEASYLPKNAERINKVGHFVDRDWDVSIILERYFVTTCLNGYIRLNILEAKEELWHAYTYRMLTNFTHIVKVKFENAL